MNYAKVLRIDGKTLALNPGGSMLFHIGDRIRARSAETTAARIGELRIDSLSTIADTIDVSMAATAGIPALAVGDLVEVVGVDADEVARLCREVMDLRARDLKGQPYPGCAHSGLDQAVTGLREYLADLLVEERLK